MSIESEIQKRRWAYFELMNSAAGAFDRGDYLKQQRDELAANQALEEIDDLDEQLNDAVREMM